jgi:hypothetical protein
LIQLNPIEKLVLFSSGKQEKLMSRMRWAGNVARMEEDYIYDIGGKTRRKETTGKTMTYVGGQ